MNLSSAPPILKHGVPGHRTPPLHVTEKQEKETRQENYRTWVSKLKPISNIKPGQIHH